MPARAEIMGRIVATLFMPKKVGPGPYFTHLGPGRILAIAYYSLYFFQFLDQIGHEESEKHGPEALRIIVRAILAPFLMKCEKEV